MPATERRNAILIAGTAFAALTLASLGLMSLASLLGNVELVWVASPMRWLADLRPDEAFEILSNAAELLGGVLAVITQPDGVIALADSPELGRGLALTKGVWLALSDGYVSNTGVPEVDDLLTRGGMSSMLNTIWLIITALSFGAVLELTGLLQRIVSSILSMVTSTGSLIASTVATCIGCNILTADQYMAIVLPGRMYKVEFEKRGLDPRNLSRTLEDSATMTSALIPWNTCGAFMASTLGVATLAYLPFAFFNYLNPIISVIYGYTGFKLIPLQEGHTSPA